MLTIFLAALVCCVSIALAVCAPLLARQRRKAERYRRVVMDAREIDALDRELQLKARERQSRQRSQARYDAMRAWLQRFRLENLTASPSLRMKLAAAGWRRKSAAVTFVFLRFAGLVSGAGLAALYTLPAHFGIPPLARAAIILAVAAIGFFLPDIVVRNRAQKRQQAMLRTFPDALDLMVICVESGISIEAAINRVSEEIADTAPILAQEFALLGAELMFLGDRRQAYGNFAERTGIAPARTFATTLTQSERYGTPVGVALRVLAQENRKERLSNAEKTASALPAKLTVPMIVCFLPGVFVVILVPVVLRMMAQ